MAGGISLILSPKTCFGIVEAGGIFSLGLQGVGSTPMALQDDPWAVRPIGWGSSVFKGHKVDVVLRIGDSHKTRGFYQRSIPSYCKYEVIWGLR